MKKLLAIVLAVVMAMGVFAVGASALPFQPFAVAAAPLSVDPNLSGNINALMNNLSQELRERGPYARLFQFDNFLNPRDFWGNSSAWRPMSASASAAIIAELEAELSAIYNEQNALLEAGLHALTPEQQQVAYNNGSIEALFRNVLNLDLRAAQRRAAVAQVLFLPEVIRIAYINVRINFLGDWVDNSPLVNNQAFMDALEELGEGWDLSVILGMAYDGQWSELNAFFDALYNDFMALIRAHGGNPPAWPGIPGVTFPAPPAWHENLPAAVQFILRWIFFGWLWM